MIILIFLSTGCLREALWTASPSVKLIFFLGFEAIPIRQGVVLSGHAASTTRLSRDSYNSRAQVEEVLFPTITTTEPLEEPTLNGRALFTRKCSIRYAPGCSVSSIHSVSRAPCIPNCCANFHNLSPCSGFSQCFNPSRNSVSRSSASRRVAYIKRLPTRHTFRVGKIWPLKLKIMLDSCIWHDFPRGNSKIAEKIGGSRVANEVIKMGSRRRDTAER